MVFLCSHTHSQQLFLGYFSFFFSRSSLAALLTLSAALFLSHPLQLCFTLLLHTALPGSVQLTPSRSSLGYIFSLGSLHSCATLSVFFFVFIHLHIFFFFFFCVPPINFYLLFCLSALWFIFFYVYAHLFASIIFFTRIWTFIFFYIFANHFFWLTSSSLFFSLHLSPTWMGFYSMWTGPRGAHAPQQREEGILVYLGLE